MNNVLKFVLLIIGVGLVGYGVYNLVTPEFAIDAGPLQFEAHGDNTQSYAMIVFGLLSLIGGLAFNKR
ncbi:hypothetical protein C8P64_2432 [Christiangramia gaetbulicola]|uniref:Uncharacterized protein n=1 Tax=Christiangramia gaetbulicola TaxID=703340 RepID=A0A2T6ADX7_9FLAO|nr:hypothetical protein [Christiangramia gaetbulicola]PTX42018.1 hypothetical protein C8P64_2432 [Christiangramia gaetbulicola]